MNEFLPVLWQERVRRLRLGIAPQDAVSGLPATGDLRVHSEDVPQPCPVSPEPDDGIGLPALPRNPSGRFAVAFGDRRTDRPPRLTMRIVDPGRRYVPRRLSLPAPDLATVIADNATPRACRPVLFPGIAHSAFSGATVVHGRVTWGAGGPPAPWVRVEARPAAGNQQDRWRAHGDARGEFVLVIGVVPLALALQPAGTLDVEIVVRGKPLPPADDSTDPLRHLPVETVGSLDPADAVASGTALPPGYTAAVTATVTCRRRGMTRPPPFVLT